MLGTNDQFEALIRGLNVRIADLERSILEGTARWNASMLQDLWAHRRSLRLLVVNRRVEAAKPVVDFQKWRTGNGAIHLCAMPSERLRRLAK